MSNTAEEYRMMLSSQYVLTIPSPETLKNTEKHANHTPVSIVLGVHQASPISGASYLDVGLVVLRADVTYGTMEWVAGSAVTVSRDLFTAPLSLSLSPGKYFLLPITSGAQLAQFVSSGSKIQTTPGEEAPGQTETKDSIPSIPPATSKPRLSCPKARPSEEMDFLPEVYRVYTEVFYRFDADGDGFLNKEELDHYLLRIEGLPLDHLAFQWLLHTFQSKDSSSVSSVSGASGLSLSAFLSAQCYMFNKTGADEEKLWHEFALLGYDITLAVCRTIRSATLSIHTSAATPFTVDCVGYEEGIAAEGEELLVLKQGDKLVLEEEKIVLYKLESSSLEGKVVSLLVENIHYYPLVMSLDCSESVNMISHRGQLRHQALLLPNQRTIMHHLTSKDSQQPSSWAYTANYLWDTEFAAMK